MESLSLRDLTQITDASRTLRSYAFLDASLRVPKDSGNPARDALDCFIPFVAAALLKQKGEQLDYSKLQNYLKAHFGFVVPIYALQQITPQLAELGYVSFNRTIGAYLCTSEAGTFLNEQKQVLAGFDDLERRIAGFAAQTELNAPPSSKSWVDALISFLKGVPEQDTKKSVRVLGTLTGRAVEIERYVVGRFIDYVYKNDPEIFSVVLSVFKGVLIEEFISGGLHASAGTVNDLTVYYDTALLLRLLGCSGRLLGEATFELHQYLIEAGAATSFLGVNENEVGNIISTIVSRKEYGDSIFGETGEALDKNEVTITDLRLLNGRFVEKLAEMNVFEARDSLNRINKPERFQIGEAAFEKFLCAQAQIRGSVYGYENRRNDAQALGSVMLFRRGHKSRDALDCKFMFVTNNKLLAQASRKFLVDQGHIKWGDFPPIIHLGQLTTIMWITRNKELEDRRVTRELLADCYAAFLPEPGWLEAFVAAFDKAILIAEKGGEESLDRGVALQAARRIARDQTFGTAELIRKLDVAEILSRAEAEKEKLIEGAVSDGRVLGARETLAAIRGSEVERARAFAARAVKVIELICVAFALISVVVLAGGGWQPSWLVNGAAVVTFLLAIFSVLDLFGLKVIKPAFDSIRTKIEGRILRIIRGS